MLADLGVLDLDLVNSPDVVARDCERVRCAWAIVHDFHTTTSIRILTLVLYLHMHVCMYCMYVTM